MPTTTNTVSSEGGHSQPFPGKLHDHIVQAMKVFDTPGCHIAIVYEGKGKEEGQSPRKSDPIEAVKGSWSIGTTDGENPLTPDILMRLDSNTKLITVIAVDKALRDNGFDIDTPIKKIMPEFQLAIPEQEELWTARDICSHRTGIPRHGMHWEKGMTSYEVFKRFKDIQPTAPFRSRFQYSNMTWAILGVMIEKLTGIPFQEYVVDEILRPLGILGAKFGDDGLQSPGRWSKVDKDGTVERLQIAHGENRCPAWWPAGGLWMSGTDLNGPVQLRWIDVLPTLPGYQLACQSQYDELIFNSLPHSKRTYGLGLGRTTYKGLTVFEHAGNSSSSHNFIANVPDLGLRLGVTSNSHQSGTSDGFVTWLVCVLIDYFSGVSTEPADWTRKILEIQAEELKDSIKYFGSIPASGSDKIIGTYEAPGLFTLTVTEEENLPARPDCTTLPYIAKLYGTQTPLFTSVGEGKFEACFRYDFYDGDTYYGDAFQAELKEDGDKLLVFGLSGLGTGLDRKDHPIVFHRRQAKNVEEE